MTKIISEMKIEKLKRNRKILSDLEIDFTEHNSETHFIIWILNKQEIDFWPTTEKFYVRDKKIRRKGIDEMLKEYKELFRERYQSTQ